MKFKNAKRIMSLTFLIIIVLISGCSKKEKTAEQKLNDLEGIINNFEPRFQNTPYATDEYTELITEWNEQINSWAEDYESGRYQTEKDGKRIITGEGDRKVYKQKEEYEKENRRWYELNNRMIKMISSAIPVAEEEAEKEVAE